MSSDSETEMKMQAMKVRLASAMTDVRKVLDQSRDPHCASEVSHEYGDKYLLAEFLTGSAISSSLSSLQMLGLNGDKLKTATEWAKTHTVTLAMGRVETCTFDKEVTRKQESDTKHVKEVKRAIGTSTVTSKVITSITEYFWDFSAEYDLYVYPGDRTEERIVLCKREGKTKLTTLSERTPHPKTSAKKVKECEISLLFKRIDAEGIAFEIDRSHAKCHTPRRNPDVLRILEVLTALRDFSMLAYMYFLDHLFPVQNASLDIASLSTELFNPMLPLFEAKEAKGGENVTTVEEVRDASGVVMVPRTNVFDASEASLSLLDMQSFLVEERRAVQAKLADNKTVFASNDGLITSAEADVVVLCKHMFHVCERYYESIDFIESMLREQLVKAIGKVVTSSDFSDYMRFHYRKVFLEHYQPKGLCYAVRREGHDPEGFFSIEERQDGSSVVQPVLTLSRTFFPQKPFKFALDAASDVRFAEGSPLYVHSYLGQRFSTEPLPSLFLQARARQFSGYIMLIGAIGGADVFLPKHAMIVKDKDDLKIPLMLEEIPTAKEFKRAVKSMSPEQQRFAAAYRSMQLEATLFGVAVVQMKPQLEAVLNLPEDALTKEIKLTRDLLELFIEYQIPSDLLSYQNVDEVECEASDADDFVVVDEAAENTEPTLLDKLTQVRTQVAAMKAMIATSKAEQVGDARMQYELNKSVSSSSSTSSRDSSSCDESCDSDSDEEDDCLGVLPQKRGGMQRSRCAPPARKLSSSKVLKGPKVSNDAAPPCEKTTETPETPDTPDADNDAIEEADLSSDVTVLPQIIEANFEALGQNDCVRPIIVKPGEVWSKESKPGLLSPMRTAVLTQKEQGKEKEGAFGLLDSLTRSGVLDLRGAEMHVFVGASHTFDKTLFDVVIEDNQNPIAAVERSVLIMASALHAILPEKLVAAEHVARLNITAQEENKQNKQNKQNEMKK